MDRIAAHICAVIVALVLVDILNTGMQYFFLGH